MTQDDIVEKVARFEAALNLLIERIAQFSTSRRPVCTSPTSIVCCKA
jgi:hypothetical protein